MRDLMRNTPGWVIVVCGTVLVALFGSFTFWLSLKGIDDTQVRGLIILLGTLFNTILSGGAFMAASASQKQTNGTMHETIRTAIQDTMKESSNARHQED